VFNLNSIGLSAGSAIVLFLIAFASGMARGFSGFGAALIFIPLASAMIGPKAAAPLLAIVNGILSASLVPGAWGVADKRQVGIMAFGSLAGVPIGTWLLVSLDPLIIRWAIVVLSSAMLFLLLSGWCYRGPHTAPATIGIGALSGVFNGAAQVGGPPVVVYWLGGTIPAAIIRANFVLFFAATTVMTTVSYLLQGLLTRSSVALSLVVGPAFGLGLFAGARLFRLSTEGAFRQICFALIALSVLLGLPVLDRFLR
jgi:uncharacterized membrane protein YfcA